MGNGIAVIEASDEWTVTKQVLVYHLSTAPGAAGAGSTNPAHMRYAMQGQKLDEDKGLSVCRRFDFKVLN